MSAWPEAVWIVKKFEKGFDIENLINVYNNSAGILKNNFNQANNLLEDLQNRVESAVTNTAGIIVNQSQPPSQSQGISFYNGLICFVYDQ